MRPRVLDLARLVVSIVHCTGSSESERCPISNYRSACCPFLFGKPRSLGTEFWLFIARPYRIPFRSHQAAKRKSGISCPLCLITLFAMNGRIGIRFTWFATQRNGRIPDVLTAEEIGKLLAELDGPYRAMAYLAAVTGLRVSELLALKWEDVQFDLGEIHLTRAIVCQHVGALKTEASQKPIPMSKGLAAVLMDWRAKCPYNQDMDYVFASQKKHGTQPLWPSSAMSKHIRPAAQRAGIHKHVRWHVFRHSLATLLKENGEDVKTVQESLRHADSKMTLDTYTQGLMPLKRDKARSSKRLDPCGPTPPT